MPTNDSCSHSWVFCDVTHLSAVIGMTDRRTGRRRRRQARYNTPSRHLDSSTMSETEHRWRGGGKGARGDVFTVNRMEKRWFWDLRLSEGPFMQKTQLNDVLSG